MGDNTTNATLTDFTLSNNDIEDTISQLKWIPNQNSCILASCGWDSRVRMWQVGYQVQTQGITSSAKFEFNQTFNTQLTDPLLSLCWQPTATVLYAGSGNGNITGIDTNTGQTSVIGKHDYGCKELQWLDMNNMSVLVSGGWDGKINFWDCRTPNPIFTLDMGKKIYTMSLVAPLLVVGMADRLISYFNLNKLSGGNFGPEATFESHLRYQTRKISVFPEKDGYAIGSIEGRVAIKYIDLNKNPEINNETKSMNDNRDFAFRCHRSGEGMSDVYPVNDIAFNNAYGTFCTGGGDGTWIIWDKDSRSRLKQGNHVTKDPITALDYSANGDILAYASGYDWAKGIAYEGSFKPKLMLHYCPDTDKKKKAKSK